jgi:hypothetical protein
VVYLTALGLGASIASANDGSAAGLRIAGALVAGVAVLTLAPFSAKVKVSVAVGLVMLVAAVTAIDSPGPAIPLFYIGCLAALLAAGYSLVAKVRDSLAFSEGDAEPNIDRIVRRELNRARRVQRPVTVASVTLDCHGRRLPETVRAIKAQLRETDVTGYAGGKRFLILFPEASSDDAIAACHRLRAHLDPAVVTRVRVGFATFPDDNPTWEGLKALARTRQRPCTRETASAASSIAPRAEPERASGRAWAARI